MPGVLAGPREARPDRANPEFGNRTDLWIPGSREDARPGMTTEAIGGHVTGRVRVRAFCPPYGAHTIRIDMSGNPCSLQSSTSPFTTGPTFSGVPE